MTKKILWLAALLAFGSPALAETLGESLWTFMEEQRTVSLRGAGELFADLVRARDYRCDEATQLTGFGGTHRGVYGQLRCGGLYYRIDLWADKSTYTIKPWRWRLDENSG